MRCPSNIITDIHTVVPFSASHCGIFEGFGNYKAEIMQGWLGFAMNDPDLLNTAILLSACRSVLREKPNDSSLTELALQYKQHGLQSLRRTINDISRKINALIVAKALALAIDEVCLLLSI
jgi:hypothetical protein